MNRKRHRKTRRVVLKSLLQRRRKNRKVVSKIDVAELKKILLAYSKRVKQKRLFGRESFPDFGNSSVGAIAGVLATGQLVVQASNTSDI